jgi:exopolysaccharide biosynthesis polyprenyl glycosylphosphotransferase
MASKFMRREFLVDMMKAADIVLMLICLLGATYFQYSHVKSMPLEDFLGIRIKVQNAALLGCWLVGWSWLLSHFHAYDTRRLISGGSSEVMDLLRATTLGTGMILVTDWFVPIEVVTALAVVEFWIMVSGATIGVRIVMRVLLRRLNRDRQKLDHLLIIGTNERAIWFANRILGVPELGYRLVGFVDETWRGRPEFDGSGYSVVTDFAGFASYLNSNVVDEVLVCLPVRSHYEHASDLIKKCEEQGIRVRFDSDLFTSARGGIGQDLIDERRLVTVHAGGMVRGPTVLIKRLVDLIVASSLLIILAPLLVVIGIAVRWDSPGPALFSQERVGLNKRRFKLFKFRTMVVDAEKRLSELESKNEVSGPVFKIKKDPRITRLGAFLRKASLDELPQLLNVVRGEMSLVGPRPLAVRDYLGFSQDWHRRRFSVRPGITCLWQVLGRNSIPFERWMELDMQYIDQWSLTLDLEILLRTIPAILRGSGAS